MRLSELHPEPISTLSSSPWPLSSVTVRHRFPSADRVNVTPVPPVPTVLPLLSSPASVTAPAPPVLVLVDGEPEDLRSAMAEETRVFPVEGPAVVPADVAPATGPAAEPPVEEGVCGTAVCCAGVALFDGWPFDDWVTEVEPGVVGAAVLFTSALTTAVPPVETGTVVVGDMLAWAACRTDSEGFEPPLPLGATAVGACCAEALVAGAAVVGVVAGATVVTGLLAVVPFAEVP